MTRAVVSREAYGVRGACSRCRLCGAVRKREQAPRTPYASRDTTAAVSIALPSGFDIRPASRDFGFRHSTFGFYRYDSCQNSEKPFFVTCRTTVTHKEPFPSSSRPKALPSKHQPAPAGAHWPEPESPAGRAVREMDYKIRGLPTLVSAPTTRVHAHDA